MDDMIDKKVFLVMARRPCQQAEMLLIFSTLEKAKAYVDELRALKEQGKRWLDDGRYVGFHDVWVQAEEVR